MLTGADPISSNPTLSAISLNYRLARWRRWRLFQDGCPGGETLEAVSMRADRVVSRIRRLGSDVLIFSHRDLVRILAARWLGLPAIQARHLYLATASLSVLGYDHDLSEPSIRLWNWTSR